MAEIVGVGGFDEVGKNMVAVKSGKSAAFMDMGFNVQKIVDYEEEGGVRDDLDLNKLFQLNAIPDDRVIASWKPLVKAIALSHCHFDHVGAVPYLAPHYKAPVYGSAYTMAVLQHMMRDDNLSVPNILKQITLGKEIKLSNEMSLEFVSVSHSTPQSSFVVLHTKEGAIIYAPDFKFDNAPIVGEKPDYERIKALRDEGVLALFVDSLYA
ncbi:MAG: ribonuclease J, partial [Nanoarchaeota archaeon]